MRPLILPILLVFACTEYEFVPDNDVGDGVDTALPGPGDGGDGGDGGHRPGDDPTCADFEPAEVFGPGVDEDCVAEPQVGSFTPVVEWTWSDNPTHPGYDDIMAAPAIADVSGDGVPDVVFATFAGGAYTSPGALVAVSGDGSGQLWSVQAPGGYNIHGSAAVGLGDIDGDGGVEVCAAGYDVAVICLDGDGSFLWAAGSEVHGYGGPALADMDGDGGVEVIFGRQIFDAEGNLLGVGDAGRAAHGFSFAVDWDADGRLEVIAGNAIYDHTGATEWTDGGYDGYPAVADFDLDGAPELVRSGGGVVEMVPLRSPVAGWSAAIPGGGNGGPPTVADFDGDGLPEVGVAALSYYTVFDTDGAVLWSNPVSDYSSSQTGSSVFDFEGDGAAEVVYADEHHLWVFDGATGAVEMQHEEHSSGTLMEYPLIADVDADGATEIVVPCNDYGIAGCNGFVVFGDADDSWGPAREVWNQHAYHITNVNNDGSIPATQVENWRSWNNFRAGGTELGPSHWRADLAPGPAEVCDVECATDVVELYLAVENSGLMPATGFRVGLYGAGPDPIWTESVAGVGPGDAGRVGPARLGLADWGAGLMLIVDALGEVLECEEGDNRADLGPWPCE